MKKFIILSLLLVTGITSANAQVTAGEPEFQGQVIMLSSDSTGVLLGKEPWVMKGKVNALAYVPVAGIAAKHKQYTVIEGSSAPQAFPAGEVRFLIRISDNTLDPNEYVAIYKFEAKKKERRRTILEHSALSALTEGIGLESGATDVPFDAKSYGESSYYVTAVLEPGEYAIYTDVNKNTMSTFRCE